MTAISRHLLAIALAVTPVALVAAEAKRGAFTGVVHVAEDGHVRVESIDGVSGALANAVRSQLESRRAIPAVRDGRPAATTAPVSGSVVLTPSGEDYDIALDHVGLQPSPTRRVPFVYPVEALRDQRAGWVEVEFALDPKGAPTDVRIVQASHPSFAKALGKPLSQWRYATAGSEPGRRYRITAAFRTDAKHPTPAFECPADPAFARLDGQPGCTDGVTIHGSRVRREVF